jgi:Spy/CpxP family protein refolding chaperone
MVNRTGIKGSVLLIIAFALGGAAGAAASHAFSERRYARMFWDRGELFETRRLGALVRKLDLDSNQREAVRAIMQKHREENRDLMRDVLARCGEPLRAHTERIDAEVRTLLRPDQQRRYDELVREQRERFGRPH